MVSWGDNTVAKYCGNKECQFIYAGAAQILKYAAMDTFNAFPDRNDKTLRLGDCSGNYADCPNHPAGTHASLHAVDVDYFTFETNCTQYCRPSVDIWEEGQSGYVLRQNVFDAERNAYFIRALSNLSPDMKMRTNNVILEALKEFDPTIGELVSGADAGVQYSHHTHFHIDIYRR